APESLPKKSGARKRGGLSLEWEPCLGFCFIPPRVSIRSPSSSCRGRPPSPLRSPTELRGIKREDGACDGRSPLHRIVMQPGLTARGTGARIVDASCEVLGAGKMFHRLAFSTTLLGLSLSAIPLPCSAAQLGDVEHIIVIYLENHSFDNL